MKNVLTQPYRRPTDTREDNYLVTLAKEYDLLSAIKLAGKENLLDVSDFVRAHPSGKARIWAVGNSAPAKRAWNKLEVGDFVIFYGRNEIYAYGKVGSKTAWPGNNSVWPSGTDWDHIYSLSEFTEIPVGSRPVYSALRAVTGKLDVQSVGIRAFSEIGLTPESLLNQINNELPRSTKTDEIQSDGHEPNRSIDTNPPKQGERFADRTAIWMEYGGQWQQGICTFPGDTVLNVFSDEDGPYPDYENPDSGAIEYRGQGLKGEQKLTHGNKMLENARLSKDPVRYWFKPSGSNWSFSKWVIVTDRETITEDDTGGESAQRILWYLLPVPSDDSEKWAPEILNMPILDLPASPEPVVAQAKNFIDRYRELQGNINEDGQSSSTTTAPRTIYKRSRDIRKLVIERSNGQCEFTNCTGMPPDRKKSGEPILEVDHINPLGEGGADHPSNMIALCPNCHEAKTHGANKEKMIKKLKVIVETAEAKLLS